METCFDETLTLQTPPAKAVPTMPYLFPAALGADPSGKMLTMITTLLAAAQATCLPHGKEVGLWTSLAQAAQRQTIQLEVMTDEHGHPHPLQMRLAAVVLHRIPELILVEGLAQPILLMEVVSSDSLLL